MLVILDQLAATDCTIVFFNLKPSTLISSLHGMSNTLLVASHAPIARAGLDLLGCGHQDCDVIHIRHHRRHPLLRVYADAVELLQTMDQGVETQGKQHHA